jgi:hypothetical protein
MKKLLIIPIIVLFCLIPVGLCLNTLNINTPVNNSQVRGDTTLIIIARQYNTTYNCSYSLNDGDMYSLGIIANNTATTYYMSNPPSADGYYKLNVSCGQLGISAWRMTNVTYFDWRNISTTNYILVALIPLLSVMILIGFLAFAIMKKEDLGTQNIIKLFIVALFMIVMLNVVGSIVAGV